MRNIMSGLLALAWLVMIVPMAAQAGSGTVNFKPGAIKAALAKGDAVVLQYRASW